MTNLMTSNRAVGPVVFLPEPLYLNSLINSFLILSKTGIFLTFSKISIKASQAGKDT